MPLIRIGSKLKPSSKAIGKDATLKVFAITDIPNTMDGLHWGQGARLMRKWFSNPAYEMPMAVKVGEVSATSLTPQQLLMDLPFDWLLTASNRVKGPIDEMISSLQNVEEFNGFIGRKRTPLTQLSRGLVIFMTRLNRIGHIDMAGKTLRNAYEDFSTLTAVQLEETSQFNFLSIGSSLWEKATDDLDDVYGALGSFAIKVAATKFHTRTNDNGWPAIHIEEVGLYVRDTYDFLNNGENQLLGYWNEANVIRPGPIDYLTEPDYIEISDKRFFKVTNDSFAQYRRRHKKGGDFVVFSTVKRYPVSIRIHLNSVDFEEFNHRRID